MDPGGIFSTLIALLIVMIAVYLGLHWAFPAADPGVFFWTGSLPGHPTEWAFWSVVGVLLSALAKVARIIAYTATDGVSARRMCVNALKGLFVAWIALLFLSLGLAVVGLLDPKLEWLSVDPRVLSAKAMIPVGFLLGLYHQVGLELASSVVDVRPRQVPRLAWRWIRRAVAAAIGRLPD
jgi:hypothetical protein